MNKYNEAINVCLQVIGEQIIEDNISIDGINEAEQADLLIEVTKEEVLSEGWSFNTDDGWVLAPNTSGYIELSPNILRVDPTDGSNYVRKEGKLYNKTDQTFLHNSTVACDIVWNTPFDEIPPIMQQYIVLKAARILYQRLVGDVSLLNILIEDEKEARLRLNIHEDDINDYNIFDDSSVTRAITRSSNPIGLRG